MTIDLLEEKPVPKFVYRQFILIFLISMVVAADGPVFAGSSVASNGTSAQAQVNFKIIILPNLALQVKTASADNMLASRINNESGNATLPDINDKTVNVTASANMSRHGVLNVSSNLLSIGNSPTSVKRAGHGAIESLPQPYTSNGQYRLEYAPAKHTRFPSPGDSPTIILCVP